MKMVMSKCLIAIQVLENCYGGNITRADLRKVSELTLTESNGITNLNDLYNFPNLTTLTLEKVSFESLNGIEYATNIRTVFIRESKINDYSSLASLDNLITLFFYKATNDDIKTLCDNKTGIGGKDLRKLTYFGVFGLYNMYLNDPNAQFDMNNNGPGLSNFSDVSYFKNLSTKTKSNISILFLNNNSISDISNLYEFNNVIKLYITGNYINSLAGLYNEEKKLGMTNLQNLYANKNNLGNEIETEDLNPSLDSLSSFSKATKSGDKYNFVKNLNNLIILDLRYNANLKHVDYIKPLNTLRELYLDNCPNLSITSLANIIDVLNKTNCALDPDISFYLASLDDSITKL